MTRWLVLLPLCLLGCAAAGPPPQASAIPYSPDLLTLKRADVANRWAADMTRLQYFSAYLDPICAPDGKWSQVKAAWTDQLKSEWRDQLWHFEPIPNQPASSGMGGMDWGALAGSILGGVIKGALVTQPRSALPPGLPPC